MTILSSPLIIPGDIVDDPSWFVKFEKANPLAELAAQGATITGDPPADIVVLGLDMGAYARGLRAPVRGLWSGVLDYSQAYDMFWDSVNRNLTLAWHSGLKEAGIGPAEMSVIERQALSAVISKEQGFIAGFLNTVMDNSKKNKGKLGPLVKSIDQWATRAIDAKNKALLLAKNDPKLAWKIGHREKHCSTCMDKLNGKVKRASFWLKAGVSPQNPPNPMLECKGWNCGCSLNVTDSKLTPGRLPSLP